MSDHRIDLVAQAVSTLKTVLERFVPLDEVTLGLVSQLITTSVEDELSYSAAAERDGVEQTQAVAAAFLMFVIVNWESWGTNYCATHDTPQTRVAYDNADHPDQTVPLARGILYWLARAQFEGNMDLLENETFLTDVDELARCVESAGDDTMAYNLAALALGNDPGHGGPTQARARYCLRLAEEAGQPHQVAMCSALLARILADDAEDVEDRRLEAFDACEFAIERIAVPSNIQQIAAEQLTEVFQRHSFLRVLYPALVFALPENVRPETAPDLEGGQLVPRVSDTPVPDVGQWARDNFTTLLWEIEVENARFKLEPPNRAASIETDSLTFDFNYPGFRRCVPHSNSILKENALTADELFLTMAHEITHVLCLIGALGSAITALRMAALHTELSIWSIHLTGTTDSSASQAEIETGGIAPLDQPDIVALGRAEQALELTAKTRILQDVWKPWMEGVAVFSESANPQGDDNGIAEQNEAVRQFVDQYPVGMGEDAKAEMLRRAGEMEERHATAVRRSGPVRLRHMFGMRDEPYFAGFLLVRSVVAAWRQTLGEALSGARAQTLLLHATRYGIVESMPDLGLPADRFRDACVTRMVEWISRLAQLSRNALADFLAPPARDGAGRSYRWRDGQPILMAPEEATEEGIGEEYEGRQRRWIHEGISTLTGDRAQPDRVAKASAECKALMSAISDALDVVVPDERVDRLKDMATGILNIAMVLPLGSVDAKFTLNTAMRRIWLLLRTREKAEHGRPGYNGESTGLSESDCTMLRQEYSRLGRPRIRVTRVVDLVSRDQHIPSGMHFLTYSYGDWISVRPAGFAASGHNDSSQERREAIRHRLAPNRLRQAEQDIARGNIGAERTLRWLERIENWTLVDHF